MQDLARAVNFIWLFKTPKALEADWSSPSFSWIKAIVLEIITSEPQMKIFAFYSFLKDVQIERLDSDKSSKTVYTTWNKIT